MIKLLKIYGNKLMKYLLITLTMLIGFSYATEVKAVVKKVESKTGTIYLAVCDSANFSLKDPKEMVAGKCTAYDVRKVDGSSEYTFNLKGIPEGEYAFYGIIDEDDDGKMKRNFIGIPKEPVFFAVKLSFKPSFDAVKTTVKGANQTIELIVQ